MSIQEIKSTELAKELGVKATDVVKETGRMRGVEYKKGTTNVKLSAEEAETIRGIFLGRVTPEDRERQEKEELAALQETPEEVEIQEEPERGVKREERPAPVMEKEPEPAAREAESAAVEEVPAAPAAVVTPEEDDEPKLPDRFKKEIEVEKVEKIKVKPGMQKAFQAIRRIEPKKWADQKGGGGKRPKDRFRRPELPAQPQITAPRKKSIKLEEGTTVKAFADLIGVKMSDVIKKLMELGYMATLNQPIDMDAALLVAEGFGVKVETVSAEQLDVVEEAAEDEASLMPRPPVVTIMGHVDHGKTSLLDAIRETKVTETEAGGITQHIGAYKVSLQGKDITFLDTPGHEAFTALRARGAKVTDIVVLVVAADDGVMPQTVEAIDHSKAANVPIVVAVNKIDKPEANPTRVRNELAERGVVSEEWGGQNIFVEVSAKKRIGIEHLLEMILLQSEVMELKANHIKPARGTIIEAKLDKGRGPVATVLIQSGTLKIGDAFVAGTTSGRVRALIDDTGKKIPEAGPSTPVEVIGFAEVPTAGDVFSCVEDERKARQIALARLQKQRLAEIARHRKLTLDELYARIKEGQIKELNIVIKGDVQGSVEAIKKSLEDITHPEVKVRVIHASVGGINESDVMLAAASNAIIIGFNVRPELKASQTAEKEGVDMRLYNIIYVAIEDVRKALEGLLEPTLREKILGRAEVRQTFHVSRLGTIAGCYVTDGMISRSSDGIRVIRDNIVVYEGKIASLKRFKEDIKEAQTGYECGITIENFNDLKIGDILENYIIEKIAAKL
ncbi:MAG: translation initiation factor IF-2 [Alphaproteobacteria bacterium]|uniref:Translation initiation factor IF-2 n=1 Tax=Candidatus Nitrobium versatile TaxID=2884831 RepID=A0A953LW39_9BACT|nr:translation initiation factor IF-2 [Candidatus Nitrobium versatile]